jgi:hypothetical protein
MEYGRLPEKDFETADIRLPANATNNSLVLKRRSGYTQFYMGTPKWEEKSG